ncbi:MAG: ATP-binding protein [Ardenticatenaceae bacterium]|nr:ATP-binding protein [Ardenticatenaceae bacterium]
MPTPNVPIFRELAHPPDWPGLSVERENLLFLERHERSLGLPLKIALLLLGVAMLWLLPGVEPSSAVVLVFILYGAITALETHLLVVARPGESSRPRWLSERLKLLVMASFAVDILFASFLIYHSGGVESEFYLLYCVLAFKAAIYYPVLPWVVFLPFFFGPLYVFVLWLRVERLNFLLDRGFLVRYALLFAVVLVGTYTAWLIDSAQKWAQRLNIRLEQKSQDLEQKTLTLQQTATNLGDRLLELRSLQEGVKAINAALAIDETLALIVTNASQVLGGVRCTIGLLEEERGPVQIRAASGLSTDELHGSGFEMTQELASWVVQHGKPILVGDTSRDGRFTKLADAEPITSIMGVPLIADGVSIGALCATSADVQAFRDDDLDLLSAFADQAAMAVKNSRLYERVDSARRDAEARLQQIAAINDVARALVSTLNLEETLNLIIERLVSLAGTSHCAVVLLDERGENLVGRTVFGSQDGERHTFRISLKHEPAAARAIRQRSPVAVPRARRSANRTQREFADRWGVESYLITPLISREAVIGAIYLGDSRSDFVFGNEMQDLTVSFASFAATTIQNARLYQDVREKSHELEAVVQGIGDGVIVTDTNLNLLIMNPIAALIFGLPEGPAIGTPLVEMIPNSGLIELFKETLTSEGDDPVMGELTVRAGRINEERVYQALAAPVPSSEGRPRGVVTVLRDITAQKELEKMKSNFLSVISHELKTPLHSIKGFVDIILMGKTGEINDLQRDFLGTVKDQTGQLQTLIQDLLEFSRLESGQLKLRPEIVDIGELAAKAVGKLAPVAEEAGVQLISNVPAPSLSIEADPVRLEQVLSNLCENAIKFTPAGGRVTIDYKDRGTEVEVGVSDTGIGIPEQELPRIFDRFYQVDASSTRRYRGTGLGLTICKHIVERHGGRLWVESSQGQGSTFHFTLPQQLPSEEELTIDFARLQHSTTLRASGGEPGADAGVPQPSSQGKRI